MLASSLRALHRCGRSIVRGLLAVVLELALLELLARHARTEDNIPMDEEWLSKVRLDTDHL